MNKIRAQAFAIDSFLALLLALALAHGIASQHPAGRGAGQARLAFACHDLINAFFWDENLYSNVTLSLLNGNGSGIGANPALNDKLIHYGKEFAVAEVAFKVRGEGIGRVRLSPSLPETYQECCFPLVLTSDGETVIACFEVAE